MRYAVVRPLNRLKYGVLRRKSRFFTPENSDFGETRDDFQVENTGKRAKTVITANCQVNTGVFL